MYKLLPWFPMFAAFGKDLSILFLPINMNDIDAWYFWKIEYHAKCCSAITRTGRVLFRHRESTTLLLTFWDGTGREGRKARIDWQVEAYGGSVYQH